MAANPPNTYYALTDKDGRFVNLDVTGDLIVTGGVTPTGTITGSLLLATGDTVDLNGEADALILDADADTTISAPTDDQIDIEIAGADDFRFTANTFTALSGSTIATNTIAETTAGSGVTADGVLLKDGGIVLADAATLEVDTVNEASAGVGVTVDGVVLKDTTVDVNGTAGGLILDADADTHIGASTDDQIDFTIAAAIDFQMTANVFTALSGSSIATNTITETTGGSGVTVDGALILDGVIQAGQQDDVVAIVGDGAITIAPSSVFLSKGSAAAITIDAPTATTHDGYIIRVVAISAQAHVITSGTVGFNAKGSSGTATFGGAIGDAITLIAYQGNWYTTGAPRNVTLA